MSVLSKWTLVIFGLLSFLCPNGTRAYDAETHALIAYKGYGYSALSQTGAGSLAARLGLDRLDKPLPFNTYWQATGSAPGPLSYYDNTTALNPSSFSRPPTEYERCQMQHLADFSPSWYVIGDPMLSGNTVANFPIQNWLIRGDLREDDISPLGFFFAPEKCPLPDVDPYGGIIRVTNHFYDPINNAPLNNGCALGYNHVCAKSVDWALGVVDSFAAPQVIDTNRRNHFTYEDARANEWLALTGERGLGTPPYTSLARANDAQERLYRWATAFRSIGDVIHLLQDGAQPQHVRNDPHSPFTSGERQAYEGYTNARVVGAGVAKVNAYVNEFFSPPQQAPLPVIVTSRYPAVMFSTPLRFFTTRLKTDGPTVPPDNRYGLMDYTNRGFFTGGTLPGSPGNTFLEPSSTIDSFYTAISQPCVAAASIANTLTNLTCKHLMHNVLDSVAAPPAYTDTLPAEFTKPPLLLQSAFSAVAPGNPIPRPHNGYSVGLEEFQTMANLTIPRAISYSAGLIDYFFRGQLAVTAPTNKVAAVLNQGVQHTMNAQGYPCMGTATTDGCALFGFVSIRVSVQNTTAQITESGTGTVVAQNLSTTLANPGPTDPQLVAVARYHRNTCYTPVLTGERVQAYSGTITEPVCSSGQTVRTLYQEISVSKPAVATAAQLVSGATPFEVHFDFSADPIPVNATDLFIQVVYRGPMGDPVLGQEQDAIAVGTLDVREPTFVAFWNNTDYFWNGTIWQSDGITYHNEGIESFWACAGPSSLNLALMYQYTGAPGFPAMVDPVVSPGDPGMVRLAFVFPPPDSSGLRKIVQGTPEQYPGGDLRIPIESAASAGQFRQANLENISAATLTQPSATCGTSLPTTAQYWCFDPIKKRRNQLFGALAIPLYLFTSGANDVDSAVPAMSQFTGTIPLQGGTVSFDTGATLGACPVQ